MGLLKETLEAIIRIDRNLAAIRKVLTMDEDKSYRSNYQQKSIEQVRQDINRTIDSSLSLFDRLPQLEIFPYPSNLTLGGRFTAVRKFRGLNQYEIATALDVTPSYVSRIEADKVIPSATIIRFFALTYNINEQWLATGKLEVRGDEVEKVRTMMGVVSPSERYPIFGRGERTRVMSPEDLKRASAGKPLQTLEQMKGQMENIKGFYSQTRQSTDVSTSDLPS